MDSRVRVVANAEQENLSVQFVDTTDWARRAMRWDWQWVASDLFRQPADCSERERVIAARDVRQTPKEIRRDTEVGRRRRVGWIEWLIVVTRPRRHNDRPLVADRLAKCLDQAEWPVFDWSNGSIRRVDEQHAAGLHAERAKLFGDLGSGHCSTHIRMYAQPAFCARARPK